MNALKALLKTQPGLYRLARSVRTRLRGPVEPELALLPFIVDPGRAAIDVGAANGSYIEALLPLVGKVVAVEANAERARELTRLFGRDARIVCAAVSSAPGVARLRIPASGWGLATIAPENDLTGADIEEQEVEQVTIDSLDPGPVGFIKIDIEGHELEALRGAMQILSRDHPALLIEAEDRHRPNAVASIRALLEPLGYRGLMLAEGRLAPIEAFDAAVHQSVPPDQIARLNAGAYKGRYINNFLFVA